LRGIVEKTAMATPDNNLHIPEDLLVQAERIARSQGRTADDLAADALKRYLAHEWLNKLQREAPDNRRRLGLESDEDVDRFVESAITEARRERRGL
jgi:hypothetical protein